MGKFTEGLNKKVQESLTDNFKGYEERMLDSGRLNPFREKRKRGRPSLEQQMRLDFATLWEIDFGRGFLAVLLRPSIIPVKPIGNYPIRIKFIQRGTSC